MLCVGEHAQLLHCVRLFAAPWTIARQAPLPMGLSRQECWSGLTFPPPGDRSDPGMELSSLAFSASVGRFFITEPPGKPRYMVEIEKQMNSY